MKRTDHLRVKGRWIACASIIVLGFIVLLVYTSATFHGDPSGSTIRIRNAIATWLAISNAMILLARPTGHQWFIMSLLVTLWAMGAAVWGYDNSSILAATIGPQFNRPWFPFYYSVNDGTRYPVFWTITLSGAFWLMVSAFIARVLLRLPRHGRVHPEKGGSQQVGGSH